MAVAPPLLPPPLVISRGDQLRPFLGVSVRAGDMENTAGVAHDRPGRGAAIAPEDRRAVIGRGIGVGRRVHVGERGRLDVGGLEPLDQAGGGDRRDDQRRVCLDLEQAPAERAGPQHVHAAIELQSSCLTWTLGSPDPKGTHDPPRLYEAYTPIWLPR